MKMGIYGGNFNPPHMGHVNAALTVAKKIGLEQIRIIPSFQSPLKFPVDGPSAEQRLEMTRRAFESYGDLFFVDDCEIRRGGISYTIDTVDHLRKTHRADEFYLIVGSDHLELLKDWKEYKKLLSEVNIVVTSRPGFELPTEKDDFPSFLKDLIAEQDFNFCELITGRSLQFIRLQDVACSSSDLRKKIRTKRPVDKFLPLAVENYVREEGLYRSIADKIQDYRRFAEFCAHELKSKKAIQVRGFDLREIPAPSEFALIASGTSTRHAVSLAENLVRSVKDEFQLHPQSVEGIDEGRWVVVDYGSLIVHVFYDYVRQEYNLEGLWGRAKEIVYQDL